MKQKWIFFLNSLAFSMIQQMLAIWSRGSSAFSKSSLNIWKFLGHVLFKPSLKNIEHYSASVWDECICAIVCTFFGIAFLRDWNENWPFPVLWPLLCFPNLLAYSVQHIYITICKIDSQWKFGVGHRVLSPVLCNNLEAWNGVGDGREVQEEGDIYTPVVDSCWCMIENNTIL